ncbi:MAG: hypothetical protein RR056_04670 [Acetivibrio sp.]
MKKLRWSLILIAAALSLTIMAPHMIYAKTASKMIEPSVADAAMYRGNVSKVYEKKENLFVTLRQEEGTNFGFSSLKFVMNKDTRLNMKKEEIIPGAYLEIYYGVEGSPAFKTETAILVNPLVEASMSVYTGKVIDFTPNKDKKDVGDILLKSDGMDYEILFHYGKETNCYLDLTGIKKGDYLTIYYSGALTRSVPPQGFALEIRKAADMGLYRGSVTNIKKEKGIITLSLKNTDDINFKNKTLKIIINKNTESEIKLSKIKKGMYLEVFYQNSGEVPTAITLEQI